LEERLRVIEVADVAAPEVPRVGAGVINEESDAETVENVNLTFWEGISTMRYSLWVTHLEIPLAMG